MMNSLAKSESKPWQGHCIYRIPNTCGLRPPRLLSAFPLKYDTLRLGRAHCPGNTTLREYLRVVASAENDTGVSKATQLSREYWRWDNSQNALQAYTILLGLLAVGSLPTFQSIRYIELPYFIGLAVCTIYIGSHKSLTNKKRQQISLKQGALVPVVASCTLFGLFLVLKFFPSLDLQLLTNSYFFLIGSFAVGGALLPSFRRAAGPLGEAIIDIDLPAGLLLDERGESIRQAIVAPSDILAVLVGLTAAGLDVASGHHNYTFNNLLACFICADILQLIGLRSFRTAVVLLAGLLIYDVAWVFGSPLFIGENVMLTVATSDILAGPTRLLFPRPPGSMGEAASYPFSLLGLGDVAVPGLLACLALRFDSSRLNGLKDRAVAAAAAFESAIQNAQPEVSSRETAHAAADAAGSAYDAEADLQEEAQEDLHREQQVSEDILNDRPYFTITLVAYLLGLGMAFTANAVTRLGQPALLYLCPCCLGAIVCTAASRGDLQRVVKFTDGPPTFPTIPGRGIKNET